MHNFITAIIPKYIKRQIEMDYLQQRANEPAPVAMTWEESVWYTCLRYHENLKMISFKKHLKTRKKELPKH